MLCPEVWNFQAPQHYFNYTHESSENSNVLKCIKSQYFNHSISLVIAGANDFPYNILENALNDCDYYRVNKVAAFELLNKEFIESFVKKGEISLLSINHKLDYQNVIAITPSGHLILNLTRESYQKLGIEGKETFFDRENHSRYVITIDLKDENFTPGKKNYDRVFKNLSKQNNCFVFDIIISWVPPEENICTSSVAAWFHKKNYLVSLCKNKTVHRIEKCVNTPTISKNLNYDEFFEWLGMFSIDGDLNPKTIEEKYTSSYVYQDPKTSVEQVDYFQYKGFLTRKKIEQLFCIIKNYVKVDNKLNWCAMDVQGFSDSPISWNLKEHNFYIDGDNSYTVVLNRDNYILRKSLSSNNKPKMTQ